MNAVKITDLRQNLPHWIARARAGERIGVSVHGKVVAELVPAPDRQAEAKRFFAKLRREMKKKKIELGDIISPIEYDWTYDLNNINPDDLDFNKLRPRKR